MMGLWFIPAISTTQEDMEQRGQCDYHSRPTWSRVNERNYWKNKLKEKILSIGLNK
jgi:hypothetical protein